MSVSVRLANRASGIHRMTALEGHKPGPERPAGVQYYPELLVQPAPVARR